MSDDKAKRGKELLLRRLKKKDPGSAAPSLAMGSERDLEDMSSSAPLHPILNEIAVDSPFASSSANIDVANAAAASPIVPSPGEDLASVASETKEQLSASPILSPPSVPVAADVDVDPNMLPHVGSSAHVVDAGLSLIARESADNAGHDVTTTEPVPSQPQNFVANNDLTASTLNDSIQLPKVQKQRPSLPMSSYDHLVEENGHLAGRIIELENTVQQLQGAKERCQKLEVQNSQLHDELGQSNVKMSELKLNFESLSNVLVAKNSAMEALQHELASCKKSLLDNAAAGGEIFRLKSELEACRQNILTKNNELEKLERDLVNLQSENRSIATEKNLLQGEVDQAKAFQALRSSTQDESMQTLQQELSFKNAELQKLSSDHAELKKKFEAQQQEFVTMKAEKEHASQMLADETKRNVAFATQLAQQQQRAESLEKDLRQAIEKEKHMVVQLNTAKESKEKIEVQLVAANSEVNRLKALNQALDEKQKMENDRYEKQIKDLHDKFNAEQQAASRLHSSTRLSMESEVEQVKEIVKNLQIENDQLKEQIAELEKEIKVNDELTVETENQSNSLKQQIEVLRGERNMLEKRVKDEVNIKEDYYKQCAIAKAELATLKLQLGDANSKIEEMRQKYLSNLTLPKEPEEKNDVSSHSPSFAPINKEESIQLNNGAQHSLLEVVEKLKSHTSTLLVSESRLGSIGDDVETLRTMLAAENKKTAVLVELCKNQEVAIESFVKQVDNLLHFSTVR